MRIEVNGVRIFPTVGGGKVAPNGPTIRETPTTVAQARQVIDG